MKWDNSMKNGQANVHHSYNNFKFTQIMTLAK